MRKVEFLVLLVVSFFFVVSASAEKVVKSNKHKPITMKLIAMLDKNPSLKGMLKTSIAKARRANPDIKTNPVRNLDEYYDFVDRSSDLIPSAMLKAPYKLVRDEVLQSLCYFYFLVDKPIPQLKAKKGLFKSALQYYPPFANWMRDFVSVWGEFLDTEASWNDKIYREFAQDPRFGLKKGWFESPSNWKTFNQFFAKRLKSSSVRPVESPNDPSVVVSPADSVPQGIWSIDKNSNIQIKNGEGLKVKLLTYYNVNDLLGKDSKYKDAFAGGKLTHTFLNVNDYHRYHFAVSGIVKEKRVVQQNVALGVEWEPKKRRYVPLDSIGWQFTQTRGVVIVDTEKHGLVALIPMGMAQISSVNFEDNVKVGSRHKKGDMLGTFMFGGSDFIMLFQKKAGFELDLQERYDLIDRPDTVNSSKRKIMVGYKHMLVGQKYGIMKGKK